MLDIKSNRLNYGELLAPPSGYVLTKAIATTYSLDLETLTAACIALGLNEATDSLLTSSKISAFNAINKVADKLVVFCEAGQVSVPYQISQLHQLFEKCIVSVMLPKQRKSKIYPSFHPKIWLLEYDEVGEPDTHKIYRLIVLSRNLTNDKSWDMSAMLEGHEESGGKRHVKPLIDFLDFLHKQINRKDSNKKLKSHLVSSMMETVKNVRFRVSDEGKPFYDYQIMPLGINESNPIALDSLFNGDSYHDLFVCSPFISKSTIQRLNDNPHRLKDTQRGILITRTSELPKIKNVADNFDVYVVKDDIVYGENELPEGNDSQKVTLHDIHAKMYLWRKWSETGFYIGSMNASERGTGIYEGDASERPVNVEMMLKLSTKNGYLNLDKIREELIGDDKNSPFQKIDLNTISELASEDSTSSDLLQEIKAVCRSELFAIISGSNGEYDVTITSKLKDFSSDLTIAPAYAPKLERNFADSMFFKGLDLSELSELYRIKAVKDSHIVEKLILIPTKGMPPERERSIVSSVISTSKDFADYVAFVLGDDAIQTMSEIIDEQQNRKDVSDHSSSIITALYERMIQTSCENPQRLNEIKRIVELIDDKTIIPASFTSMYHIFLEALKSCQKKL